MTAQEAKKLADDKNLIAEDGQFKIIISLIETFAAKGEYSLKLDRNVDLMPMVMGKLTELGYKVTSREGGDFRDNDSYIYYEISWK